MQRPEYLLGIDYGEKRVGVAIAHEVAQLPQPLVTISNDAELFERLDAIISKQGVNRIVVGMPRNMDGSLGFQAEAVSAFVGTLQQHVDTPVVYIDETLSSIDASASDTTGAGLDAHAAAVILERYFAEQRQGSMHT